MYKLICVVINYRYILLDPTWKTLLALPLTYYMWDKELHSFERIVRCSNLKALYVLLLATKKKKGKEKTKEKVGWGRSFTKNTYLLILLRIFFLFSFLLGWVSLQSLDLLSLFLFLFFSSLISSCVKLSRFCLFGQISLFPL